MEPWVIAVIVVAVVAVLALLVLLLRKGKKRTPAEATANDRELISENERAMAALLVLCEGNEAFSEEIKKVREQVKYLTPVDDPKIVEFDKKIKNQIEDMRIALNKDGCEDNIKAINALTQLRLLITDRNAKI